MADAALGDQRLRRRAQRVVAALAARRRDAIPQATGSWPATKAAYRLLANERVACEELVGSIGRSTARVGAGRRLVAAVQDTSTLSLPRAQRTEGLGPVTTAGVAGLLGHSTLAVGLEGQVLGLLGQHTWSRPRGQRESLKWLDGLRAARLALAAEPASPRLIHILDREGDITDVFAQILTAGEGAVIRSARGRRVATGDGLITLAHRLVAQAPVLTRPEVEVPRRPRRPARTAQVEVRAVRARLVAQRRRPPAEPRLNLGLVEVRETNPPVGAEPLLWHLWTTEPVETGEEALVVVALHRLRWKIEEVHLVLKSGCRVEDLRLGHATRLSKVVALYTALAARVVQLRDLSRLQPQAPCTRVLSDSQWRALWTRIQGAPPAAAERPPALAQATAWIGRLGGHLGRKGDGPPGVRTLWRGLRDLALLADLFEALHRNPP